jgi:hypothetical protein
MAKPAPVTFAPTFALATIFRVNAGHGRRVSDCGSLAVLVTGRKAKTNAEIVAAVQPAIDAGLVRVRIRTFAPKGCPGGKARPALVDVAELELTPAGLVAVAVEYPAVDAWRAELDRAQRARLLAEITASLAKASPEAAWCAAVHGELRTGHRQGPTPEALEAAPTANLVRVARSLELAIARA